MDKNSKYSFTLTFIDLHVHSHYSDASSPAMTVENITKKYVKMGMRYWGGDGLCDRWIREIEEYGYKCDGSIWWYEDEDESDRIGYVPSCEVNLIWGKKKQAHFVLIMYGDELKEVKEILKDDIGYNDKGRPIITMSPQELINSLPSTIIIIPAHILTPWYGLLGDRCRWGQKELVETGIQVVETGLSADIGMVKGIEGLEDIKVVSFSDAHSINKLGREFTGLIGDVSGQEIKDSIMSGKMITFERPPQLGKYYTTGCRKCNMLRIGNEIRCGRCNKPLPIGAFDRYIQLGVGSRCNSMYVIGLEEIKEVTKVGYYGNGKELDILTGLIPCENGVFGDILHEIRTMGKNIITTAGYDGVYGSWKWKGEQGREW